jgi:hypothetical protein
MSYVSVKTAVTLNPEFFRQEALKYNANPTDRKQWLQKQVINLEAALNRYATSMQDLMERGAKLDGVSTVAQWMTGIGGVAVTIPTGYSQIGGVVLLAAGMIVSAFDKKKDSKALKELQAEARKIQLEVSQIQTLYANYKSELTRMQLLPIAMFATAAYIISNQ